MQRAVDAAMGRPVPVVVSPVLDLVPLDPPDRPEGELILTSTTGARRAVELGYHGRAWCVGDRTADVAQSLGLEPVSAQGAVDDLFQLIRDGAPKRPLVHVRGQYVAGNLLEQLRQIGMTCHAVIAYDQRPRALNDAAHALIEGDQTVVVPLFSPRSSALFWEQVSDRATLRPVAISAAAGQAVPKPARIAKTPDMPGMLDAICAELSDGSAS